MKVSASADVLRAALQRAGKVIEARNVIPILGSIRFEADGTVLSLTASNYDISITAMLAAEVEEPGVACIPAAELIRLVGLAKKAPVQIETTDRSAIVSWGRTSAELLTFDPGEFPIAPDYGAMALQDVDGALLARALRFAAVSMSDEETRYHLMGVYLAERDGGATATATDGHMLHRATMPSLALTGAAIIPAKQVPVLAEMLEGGGRTRFAIGPSYWAAETDSGRARGSLVEGTFPDADRVIHRDPELAALAGRDELREAIEIAATGADKAGRTVHVVLDAGGDEIAIRGFKPGVALAKGAATAIAAETRAEMLAVFNATYLQDSLRAIESERVAVFAADEMIVHIEPAEQAVELRLKAVIMGVRTTPAELAA